jgi:polar amino acid transport system substrate-binding protein
MMTKNHPMLAKVNDTISAMKKDGSMAAIHKKWFGTDAAPDSSTLAARAIPGA